MAIASRAVEQDDARVAAEILQNAGKFFDGRFAFGATGVRIFFFHTDGTIENHDREFRGSAGGQAQPAT